MRGRDALLDHTLSEAGAYPALAELHRIVLRLSQVHQSIEPHKSKMAVGPILQKFVPSTNCRKCGKPTCLAFAIDLAKGKAQLEDRPILVGIETL